MVLDIVQNSSMNRSANSDAVVSSFLHLDLVKLILTERQLIKDTVLNFKTIASITTIMFLEMWLQGEKKNLLTR